MGGPIQFGSQKPSRCVAAVAAGPGWAVSFSNGLTVEAFIGFRRSIEYSARPEIRVGWAGATRSAAATGATVRSNWVARSFPFVAVMADSTERGASTKTLRSIGVRIAVDMEVLAVI